MEGRIERWAAGARSASDATERIPEGALHPAHGAGADRVGLTDHYPQRGAVRSDLCSSPECCCGEAVDYLDWLICRCEERDD